MKDREIRSQDTMPWSISSRKAVRVKANISPKLQETREPLLGQQTSVMLKKCDQARQSVHSLGAALHQTSKRPDALHVDELCREGRVRRQLGQLFQGLQPSVDAVGLDPLQELTGGTGLSDRKQRSRRSRKFSRNSEKFQRFGKNEHTCLKNKKTEKKWVGLGSSNAGGVRYTRSELGGGWD